MTSRKEIQKNILALYEDDDDFADTCEGISRRIDESESATRYVLRKMKREGFLTTIPMFYEESGLIAGTGWALATDNGPITVKMYREQSEEVIKALKMCVEMIPNPWAIKNLLRDMEEQGAKKWK